MKRKRLAMLTAACLLLACLTGCAQDPAEPSEDDTSLLPSEETADPPEESHTLLPQIFSLPYNAAQTLDPITCSDGAQQVVASLLYEGLFRLDHTMQPQPWLCSSYSYEAETYTYVFTLRSGVMFSDGTPLTAADVLSSLDRAQTASRYSARFTDVVSVRAGDGIVAITLSAPNAGFPALLDIPIVKADTETAQIPIGTGPYRYGDDDGVPALHANPHRWHTPQLPVDFIGLVDADSREAMLYRFTSHDVQLITADLTGANPISVTGDIVCQDAMTSILQYLVVNTAREPLNRPDFRQALSMGVNRPTLVSAYLSGHGAAAQFPLLPSSPLYPTDLEQRYSYDDFTAAVAAAGYENAEPLTLLVSDGNSFRISAAGFLAESYTAAGIPTQVRILPWEEYLAALRSGDFDLCYCEVKLTADWDLRPLLATGGSLNYGLWADSRTDALLNACLASSDGAADLHDLCLYLQEQMPIIPLCFKSTSVLMQADVLEGTAPTMTEVLYDLDRISVYLQSE